MFIKYYLFDWPFLFTNAMWIIGAALVFMVASYAEYEVSITRKRRRDIYVTRSINSWLFIGFILIASGYALSPSESFIAREAFRFVDIKTYDMKTISASRIDSAKVFKNQDIEMFNSTDTRGLQGYLFDAATITMSWNGFLGTPFVAFEKGKYALEFEASGAKAVGEFSKILVYTVILTNNRLSLKELLADLELSAQRRPFSFIFQAEAGQLGKARIQLYNDPGDEQGGDRNAFIGKIKIKKIA